MRGHRTVPHTADLRVVAWGETREDCLAEAVLGMVESFAEMDGLSPRRTAIRHVTAPTDEDLLVAVLDEVIYGMDADDEIPVVLEVKQARDGGVDLVMAVTDITAIETVGAIPKAVSLHELACAADSSGCWQCSVTVDV